MGNDNITKPSLLNTNSIHEPNTSIHGSNPANTIDISQLQKIISDIINVQNKQLIDQLTNSSNTNNKNEFDQGIDPIHQKNINDMDKIPDVVKSLREFSGQPGEFGSWKKSVERVLRVYDDLKGTPKYYGIISVIRNKITGSADTALESYNTPLNWERIAKCLTMHYADKRDLGTLEYQMTTLIQKNSSITEFYQQVYHHLSLIFNKLSSMDMSQEAMNVMTQSYREKALDTFVRGLRGDLPRLLSMRGPTDLPEALHLCLKLENVQYRVQHSQSNSNIQISKFSQPPPLLPRRTIPTQQYNSSRPLGRQDFHPSLLHDPQVFQSFPRPQQYNYQHPSNSRQFSQQHFQQPPRIPNRNYIPKPEPMEVDHSIHSRRVDYQNRPQIKQIDNKRPYSNQVHQPVKFQRIYHSEACVEDKNLEKYQEQMTQNDLEYDQTFLEYTHSQENPKSTDETEDNNDEIPIEQLEDINFLD